MKRYEEIASTIKLHDPITAKELHQLFPTGKRGKKLKLADIYQQIHYARLHGFKIWIGLNGYTMNPTKEDENNDANGRSKRATTLLTSGAWYHENFEPMKILMHSVTDISKKLTQRLDQIIDNQRRLLDEK